MPKGSHLDTLRFEHQALKRVLESQTGIMLSHAAIYEREAAAGRLTELQAKCSRSVFKEYRDQAIPRTERMIAALEWAIDSLTLRYTV